jgi:hypothetical protein
MFYAGLDCAKFTENVLKVGKYAGPDPCAGKASDYYFKGLEASLLGRVLTKPLFTKPDSTSVKVPPKT